MNLQFATCERRNAIRFLQTGYPNRNLKQERLPKLCKALDDDIVRVFDPKFHTLALVAGKNYKDEHLSLMHEIKEEIGNSPLIESEVDNDAK